MGVLLSAIQYGVKFFTHKGKRKELYDELPIHVILFLIPTHLDYLD